MSCLSLNILLPLIRQTFVQPAAGSNINLIAAICEWRKTIKTNLVDSFHISQCDRHGATGELCLSIVGLCQDNTLSSHLCFLDLKFFMRHSQPNIVSTNPR